MRRRAEPTGRRVNRITYLPAFLLLLAAVPAAGDVAREDLVGEILKQVPDWPQAQVEMPLSVYEQLIRDIVAGPVLPKPPEATWIERVAWTVEVGESEAAVAPVFDVVSLPGVPPQTVRLLPAAIVWRDAAVDDRKIDLRRDKDGWFYFDPPQAGRYRVVAKASIKASPSAEGLRVGFQTPKAALAAVAVESREAWEVRFKGSPLAIVGDEKGTRGTAGLAPGTSLEVTWRRPQPPVHREAQIEARSEIGWTLGEGAHQVRAILNLRLWGGETSELTVNLPPGADRVSIAGPDVREVQVQGAAARVFLRGAIAQRTRLVLSFESPRSATGRMILPMFGVAGAAQRGGTLAIAGGAGGVLLELDPAGMAPVALADLPDETRALLSAPAMYGYTLTGGAWEARVDLVGLSEFPVRETLADSALYTVLYRPDGHVMVKVIYEVRNRGQQYMRVDLPEGAQLIVARVAEQHRPLARGPDHGVYVPLEKSVLTTAGLISFPVEIVYVMRGPGLTRQGQFRLPLARIDLPVAYARCALMLPDGLKAGEWQGTLRRVPVWSGETANLEFEYGTGHLAKLPPKAVKAPRLGRTPAVGQLFGTATDSDVKAQVAGEPDLNGPADPQNTVLQAKNLYRGGVDYYQRGNYEKAGEMFRQVMTVAPKSLEAENAAKYLGNIDIARGKDSSGAGGDRSLRATAKAVQMAQQAGNVEFVEKQQEALERAEEALQKGDESKAEAAYKVAVNLAGQLAGRGEVAREQEATVRKAKEFLGKQELGRQEESKKLADLQQQIASLKGSIAEKGGKEMAQVVEALAGDDTAKPQAGGYAFGSLKRYSQAGDATPGRSSGARGGQPGQAAPAAKPAQEPRPTAPQVEMNEALAEQQLKLGDKLATSAGRAPDPLGGGGGGGRAARPSLTGGGTLSLGSGRIAELQKQVEQLRELKEQITPEVVAYARVPPGTVAHGFADIEARAATNSLIIRGTEADRKTLEEMIVRPDKATGMDARVVVPEAPAAHATPAPSSALGLKVAEKAKSLGARADQAAELARQGRVVEADALVKNLEMDYETTHRAAEVVRGRSGGTAGRGFFGGPAAKAQPAPDFGLAPGMKTPESSTSAALPGVSGLVDLGEARQKLEKARQIVSEKSKELNKVQIDVRDLTVDLDGDEKLAAFVANNYAWALQPKAGQGQATVRGEVNLRSGIALDVGGGVLGVSVGEGHYDNSVTVSNGTLVLANDPGAINQVQRVLDRLRVNMGQRVPVGSRNVLVPADTAVNAGIQWKSGANGVSYAMANEGQLLALLDLEQRAANTGVAAGTNEVRLDTVVGTSALVANGGVVEIARAADKANTLAYNGNTLEVPLDDYLVINNGRYLTAVKTGRMQHWSVEAEPVRFPGVPAAVVVPAVGYTVKFEKTLLDTSDTLELVTDYTWEGEKR
jgi:TolA-binding protein